MLLEIAFAMTPRERRTVVIYVCNNCNACGFYVFYMQKYIDAFASALGFFFIGYIISDYQSPQCIDNKFFEISDPVLWFFKVIIECVPTVVMVTTNVYITVHICQ